MFGNNAGTFVVFISALALPVLSALTLLLTVKQAHFRPGLVLPGICAKGEETQGALTIAAKGLFPVIGTCRLMCVNVSSGEQTSTALHFEADRRQETELKFLLQPLFSGDLRVCAECFALTDPLGLFQMRLNCTSERIISVLPDDTNASSQLDETPDSMADNDEYSMTRPGSDTSEIYAIRPYVPGDPIRSIHWKLTEKLDKLMVREFGRPLTPPTIRPPETSASPEAPASEIEGACLCKAVPKRGSQRLFPWLFAVALLVIAAGSLFSMLEMAIPDRLTVIPLRLQTIADGFALLGNRLFTISEQYQAYKYDMLSVAVPQENHGTYIMVITLIIAIIIAIISYISAKNKSTTMFSCLSLLFLSVQMYFGVFPAALWSILLCAALVIASLQSTVGFGALRRTAPFGALMAVLFIVLFLVYPGKSPALTELSETIRDGFDEKVERPITAVINPQEALSAEQLLDLQMRAEAAMQNERPGGGEYNTEHNEGFSGSKIGTAVAQRLWVFWLILLLFIAAFIVWSVIRFRAYAKRVAEFDSPDCAAAINSMFLHLVQWLLATGLKTGDAVYSEYVGPIETLVSTEYAGQYLAAVDLWQEAAYSEHELTTDDRLRMRQFMDTTVRRITEEINLLTQAKLRLRLVFGKGDPV